MKLKLPYQTGPLSFKIWRPYVCLHRFVYETIYYKER